MELCWSKSFICSTSLDKAWIWSFSLTFSCLSLWDFTNNIDITEPTHTSPVRHNTPRAPRLDLPYRNETKKKIAKIQRCFQFATKSGRQKVDGFSPLQGSVSAPPTKKVLNTRIFEKFKRNVSPHFKKGDSLWEPLPSKPWVVHRGGRGGGWFVIGHEIKFVRLLINVI